MLPEEFKTIMNIMAKNGIIKFIYDPCSPDPVVETWFQISSDSNDRHLQYIRPSRQETEFYAREYDKCFGTAPRTDEG